MIKAVLFDLDGTLLDIDLNRFLSEYFAVLGPAISELTASRLSPSAALQAVLASTEAMNAPHTPRTNQSVFEERFEQLTGIDLAAGSAPRVLERFYRETFPGLRHTSGPTPYAAQAVSAARDRGLRTALATNPIFPLAAIRERARWAGLELAWFDHVTSYETSTACKPRSEYFSEIALLLGVDTDQCLMVGDDPALDLPARDVGMEVLLVGAPRETGSDAPIDTLTTLCELIEHFG
jgi:FMN phosphatase YigB (HAD superfamily)